MKIIAVDNWNREYISDILICENAHKYYGKVIVEILNTRERDLFFRFVEDNEKLYKFEP